MKLLLVVALLALGACAPSRAHVNFAAETEPTVTPAATSTEPAAPTDERATDQEIDLGLTGAAAGTISVETGGAPAEEASEGEEEEDETGEAGEESDGADDDAKPSTDASTAGEVLIGGGDAAEIESESASE